MSSIPSRSLVQAAAVLALGLSTTAYGQVINEISADPDATLGDANGDGVVDTSQDEFVEIVNDTGGVLDLSGWTIADGFSVRHTFPGGTTVVDGGAIVVFGGGTPTGSFGGAIAQTSSGGSLGLNNGGDTVTLADDLATTIAQVVYGGEGGNNNSLTRDPDVTGAFVEHTLATGSGGALFSPGTMIDGTGFNPNPVDPDLAINEFLADPDAALGDANGDGTVNTSQDEFVELVNISGALLDVTGWTLSDGVSVRHTFPAGSVVVDGGAIVVFGGGTPTGTFGDAIVQVASGGSLGLNNGGDTITIADGGAITNVSYSYGGEGGNNQSITRDPDVTGVFVEHSTATGSGGALFSPGTMIDGTPFNAPPPSSLVILNEYQYDPAPGDDTNGDGNADTSEDEFIELVNNSGGLLDISGWVINDAVGLRHTFPAETFMVDGGALVVFGGGTPTGDFGGALVQTASTGFLGLNNGGDTIELLDGSLNVIFSEAYADTTDDQSVTRDPDLIGGFVEHTSTTGGLLNSPGTFNDGVTPFAAYPPPPGPPADTLVMTEIAVTPTSGEFIEIYNPGPNTIDLTNYYLSDATFAGGSQFYYNTVTGFGGGGGFGDFNARFPAGATIAPNTYITVAMSGSDGYFTEYGVLPDFELWDDAGAADGVPQMLEATDGSINGQGGLTNSGEMAVLYYWDGNNDLVTDVDYAVWGDKAEAVDKSFVVIDGPDFDTDTSVYGADTIIDDQAVVAGADSASHAIGNSWQRRSMSEGQEVRNGGNGARGHDETSENAAYTWVDAAVTPGTATVGAVECGLTTDGGGLSTLTLTGATPDGLVFLFFSLGEAGTNLGPCPGESIALTLPALMYFVAADSLGELTVSGTIETGIGELGVQIVDATTCVVSNPVFDTF